MDYHFIKLNTNNYSQDIATFETEQTTETNSLKVKESLHEFHKLGDVLKQSTKIAHQRFSNMNETTMQITCNAHFFVACTFESCIFKSSDFSLSTFYHCTFYDCNFFDNNMLNMGMFNCSFVDCQIKESILRYSRFIDGSISSLYIEDCDLKGTMFYFEEAHTRNIITKYSNNEDAYFNE